MALTITTHEPKSDPDTWVKVSAAQILENIQGSHNLVLPLKECTKQGQYCRGTTVKARYRVLLVGPSIKIAGRLKGGTLSLRAEFTNTGSQADGGAELLALGFKNSGSHMSLHLGLDYKHKDEKILMTCVTGVVGAVYAALMPYLSCPFPDASIIAEGVA